MSQTAVGSLMTLVVACLMILKTEEDYSWVPQMKLRMVECLVTLRTVPFLEVVWD